MNSGVIYHIFLLNLRHRSATTAVVWNDFNEKVLLKLSSLVKFSQNFSVAKVIGNGTAPWFVQPLLASYITFGVGCCLYPRLRQCEKPH